MIIDDAYRKLMEAEKELWSLLEEIPNSDEEKKGIAQDVLSDVMEAKLKLIKLNKL